MQSTATGHWKVLGLSPKTYTVDWKRKTCTVSIERLQPAYVLADLAEQPVRCAQSVTPNQNFQDQETSTNICDP